MPRKYLLMGNRKFVFLDRDGVLNRERGEYTYSLDHFSMVEGVGEALALLRDKGFAFAVVTNQSGIAKGLYTEHDMHRIHKAVDAYLKDYGVDVLAYYYCPHHPSFSKCLCRKPDSSMLERAAARFDADISNSWFVGDKERDMQAGRKAGLKTLLVASNEDLRNRVQEFE